MTRPIVFSLYALALVAPGIAQADVALQQPSDSVVAISFLGAPCGGAGTGEVVNSRILPDGSIAPFVIPAGYAFMVTGIDYVTGNNPGGGTVSGDRIGFTLTTVVNDVVIAEGYAVNTGAPGSVSGTAPISTPMPVTAPLCLHRTVGNVIGGTRTWVRGFLYRFK